MFGVPRPLRCLLLGEELLVSRCAEVLRERGHTIAGIVTRSPAVRRWAEDAGVPVVERAEYPGVLEREPVDVLLSITHPALIAPEVIRKARLAAVNYHDGPLPRYAGMNGSAWAILNGEASHALVWHHITAGLDEGDILERRDYALDPRETSVSLNVKNAALALESFQAVVHRLETGNLEGTPQRTDVERLVFSRHDRPAALAILDFARPAAELDRIVRACDFGPYANRFGAAKVLHGDRAVIVRESAVTDEHGTPGTVLGVGASGIDIATGAGCLRVLRATTLAGKALTLEEAASLLGIAPGTVLDGARRAACAPLSRALAEVEPASVAALSRRAPLQLSLDGITDSVSAVPVELPSDFGGRFEGRFVEAVASAFAFLLGSIARETHFDLALVHGPARARFAPAEPLLYPSVPLALSLEDERGFSALVESTARALDAAAKRAAFVFDLVARHPNLAEGQAALVEGELSQAALVLGDAALPCGALVGLRVDGATVRLEGRLGEDKLRALAKNLACVAQKVVGDPERPLAAVDLLDEAERHRQIFEWNATERAFPDHLLIHEPFEAQAERRPDAVALVSEGRTLTFAEVEQAANRIANALIARGVTPGQYVALLVERGFDLPIAMLGIAKSGAAYVPIDAMYPEDRARFMIDDARCVAVLASSGLAARAGEGRSLLLVDGPEVRAASAARPARRALPTDVCYAIYTSGSTGKPKGVVLTHKAVLNTFDWVNRTFGVTEADRLLFVTSPGFDLSVYDVFGALGAGASVEIASVDLLAEPTELVRKLSEPGVTIWDSAPPALSRLAPFFPESAPSSSLRLVMLSGDWIPVWLPGALAKTFAGVSVKSLGGATEAAIWSNYFHVDSVDPSWTSIPYGYPIQNARYYVLDARMRPLPPGIAGDLYIGGTCLAAGYLNREELTRERFLPDPFRPGERIYKTGDLARYWNDGTMEFLGRADFQVKIRGFRVELGEIETVLGSLEGVRDALCTAYVDASGQKSLVAYVVPKRGVSLDEDAVRDELARKLPEFMVPSHVIVLPAFPISANGKVDRKALPSPSSRTRKAELVAPSTDIERTIVEIWEKLFDQRPIGVTEDFFSLGGHSLLVVTLVTEIKRRFGVEIPLRVVFSAPTVRALADFVDAALTVRSGIEVRGDTGNQEDREEFVL